MPLLSILGGWAKAPQFRASDSIGLSEIEQGAETRGGIAPKRGRGKRMQVSPRSTIYTLRLLE
jgi:hypothetical protein